MEVTHRHIVGLDNLQHDIWTLFSLALSYYRQNTQTDRELEERDLKRSSSQDKLSQRAEIRLY